MGWVRHKEYESPEKGTSITDVSFVEGTAVFGLVPG
jgi:hypothetical protein